MTTCALKFSNSKIFVCFEQKVQRWLQDQMSPLLQFGPDTAVNYLQLYNLFGLFWGLFFASPSGRWCSQGCTEESQISDPAKKMLVFYQKFKECGIMFLKNSENTSGAFASWYWAMDKDKDVPTLPILASFWRTFRSACPHFPYSPAFGGNSVLHAHPSHTCQL